MPRVTLFVHLGQRIGRGIVIDTDVKIPRSGRMSTLRGARLICDCGNEYVSALQALVGKRPEKQRTQSCGCLRREHQIASATKHGAARRVNPHPLAKTWEAMIARCENPQTRDYGYWGGRGIAVCERWHDFSVFTADIYDQIGPRPEECYPSGRVKYTLDRVDNDGNYEPGNVRWATQSEQMLNRRPFKRTRRLDAGYPAEEVVLECALYGILI